jgi:hypothetical protein
VFCLLDRIRRKEKRRIGLSGRVAMRVVAKLGPQLLVPVLFAMFVGAASAQPNLVAIDPPYGAPGTLVTLSGENLDVGDPAVTVCENDAGPVQTLPDHRVQITTPPHAVGITKRCDVTLTTEHGSSTLEKAYTYFEPPPIGITHRRFAMGFVPLLLGPTDDPIRVSWYWNDARLIAAQYGDIVSILNSVWDHCDGGVPHLPDLTSTIDMTRWFHEFGVQVFVGLECTTDYRSNVGYCPGDNFGTPHVWDDFEAQVRFLFASQGPGDDEINYPDYLMVGIEMNMYYLARPEDWDNYRALVAHLREVVREYTDKTKLVVSFQLDVLTSRWYAPIDHDYPRQWEIFRDLAVDVLGISFYATWNEMFCGYDPSTLAPDVFAWFTDPANNPRQVPIAITETGYSAVYRGDGFFFCGSELHQHNFLVRLAEIAQHQNTEFLIWWALHEGTDTSESGAYFRSMRMVTQDRECYPDCYPTDPDCTPECPLDPQGGLAFDAWQDLFALLPGLDDDDDDDDNNDNDTADDDNDSAADDDDADDTSPVDDDDDNDATSDDDSADDDSDGDESRADDQGDNGCAC